MNLKSGDLKVEIRHVPVLLKECLDYLSPVGEVFENDAFMVDSTTGEGGHSIAFLSSYPSLNLKCLDVDPVIQAKAKIRLDDFVKAGRVSFYSGWFNDFYADFDIKNERRPDILLFDLGISVFHYEESERGFSFRNDEVLDMRINPLSPKTAADIVNDTPEKELADLIYFYSDEKYSRRIASAICEARASSRIETSKALADIIYGCVPSNYRYGNIHPATRTFQALRIVVNGELNRLPKALFDAFNCLAPGGKMGVITFHSLEDKIVKNFFRNLGKQCVCPPEVARCRCEGKAVAEILTRKPVEPTAEEIKANSPSRSAKLRVIRKIADASKYRLEGVAL